MRAFVLSLLMVVGIGCAVVARTAIAPGGQLTGGETKVSVFILGVSPGTSEDVLLIPSDEANSLAAEAEFTYGCPRERVRLIRWSQDAQTFDIDTCGAVRRYKLLEVGKASFRLVYRWADVTATYPASTLPPPLPPQDLSKPLPPPAPPSQDRRQDLR